MSKTIKILVQSILMLGLIFSGNSMADELDVDQLMQEFEKRLQVGQEKYEQLKPELKSALDAKSKELSSSMDTAFEQSLTQLETLGEQYEAASKASSEKLRTFMESDDVTEFKNFLSGLDEDAIRERRDKLVAEFVEILALTTDQIEAIKPLLSQKLENLGAILSQYLHDSKDNFEQFRLEFEAETQNNIEQFKALLNPEQFEKYENGLNGIEEAIRNDVFEA